MNPSMVLTYTILQINQLKTAIPRGWIKEIKEHTSHEEINENKLMMNRIIKNKSVVKMAYREIKNKEENKIDEIINNKWLQFTRTNEN